MSQGDQYQLINNFLTVITIKIIILSNPALIKIFLQTVRPDVPLIKKSNQVI